MSFDITIYSQENGDRRGENIAATVRCVWCKKLKFNSLVYFGPVNGPKLASIFSCKNVVFFSNLISIKLIRDKTL